MTTAATTTQPSDDARPVLLFDGVCNVCNAFVQLVVHNERGHDTRFCSLQSEAGRALVRARGLPDDVSTVVLVRGDRAFVRSAAVVRVLWTLRAPFPLLGALLWLVPWPLRDLGYAVFARLRYRLFGRRDACMIPTPELLARFL